MDAKKFNDRVLKDLTILAKQEFDIDKRRARVEQSIKTEIAEMKKPYAEQLASVTAQIKKIRDNEVRITKNEKVAKARLAKLLEEKEDMEVQLETEESSLKEMDDANRYDVDETYLLTFFREPAESAEERFAKLQDAEKELKQLQAELKKKNVEIKKVG